MFRITSQKSGKNRNPRKSEKKSRKILRNPPKKTQIFSQTLKNTHKPISAYHIVTNVTLSILNHNDNNDRIKNIRTRLESNCKLSIRLVFESTPNFTIRTPLPLILQQLINPFCSPKLFHYKKNQSPSHTS